jgi:hypothetical protein
MTFALYRLTPVATPPPVLDPGHYLISHGSHPAVQFHLWKPLPLRDLADMIEQMRESGGRPPLSLDAVRNRA